MAKVVSQEKALENAKKKLDGKFEVVDFVFTGWDGDIHLVCDNHGRFTVKYKRLDTVRCPICADKRKPLKDIEAELEKKIGDRYSYKVIEYKGSASKIEIDCSIHGKSVRPHTQVISSLFGCIGCGNATKASVHKYDTRSFIERSKSIFGDFFDYSLVEYVNSLTPVKLICPKHGLFEQSPELHVNSSYSCPDCAKYAQGSTTRISFEDFEARAIAVHQGKYKYHKDCYEKLCAHTKITCKDHGDFWQKGNDHVFSAAGCPTCSYGGFDINTEGWVYLLTGKNGILKVGITNRDVEVRVKELNKDGTGFKIVSSFKASGEYCVNAEKEIHQLFDKYSIGDNDKFAGYTECFKKDCFNDLSSAFIAYKMLK